MRRRVVVIGIVLALVAITIWYVPLQTISSTFSIPQGKSQVVGLQAPLDVLGAPITYSLRWSSSSSSVVSVYRCGTTSVCSVVGPGNLIASGSGRSGTLSWSGRPGNYFHIIPSGPVQITFQELEPLLGGSAGIAMLAFSGFLAGFGVWLPALPSSGEQLVPRVPRNQLDEDPAPPPRRNR